MQNKRHYLIENEKTRTWSIQCWPTHFIQLGLVGTGNSS